MFVEKLIWETTGHGRQESFNEATPQAMGRAFGS
jgi:hypothetical protein